MENNYQQWKALLPNEKELARADGRFTVVVRPNKKDGGYLGSVVTLEGRLVFPLRKAETREELRRQLRDDLRMLAKCGFEGMYSASRARQRKKDKKCES